MLTIHHRAAALRRQSLSFSNLGTWMLQDLGVCNELPDLDSSASQRASHTGALAMAKEDKGGAHNFKVSQLH